MSILTFFKVPQKEVGKRSSITFFCFRDSFGHFWVTFSDAPVTFFVTFFAKLLLPDSFCGRVTSEFPPPPPQKNRGLVGGSLEIFNLT